MEMPDYLEYHARRFDYLLAQARSVAPTTGARILDVGPGPLTERLAQEHGEVWSIGFDSSAIFGGADDRHITYDLALSPDPATWPALPGFDVIIFSEVIEHLYCDPGDVLRFLASGLRGDGVIVCTTPNIASFHKRLRCLTGRTPWVRWSSGHCTEFDRHDLHVIAAGAGLGVVHHEYANYFGILGSPARRALARGVDTVTGVVPSLRRGQSVWLRRCAARTAPASDDSPALTDHGPTLTNDAPPGDGA